MPTKEENKKPLIVPEAGNAAVTDPKNIQDYAKPDNQVGLAGNQVGTELKDDTPTLTEPQVNNIKHAPSGVKIDDLNKVPGRSTPTIAPSAINSGVLAGAPPYVVLDHMINGERKPRTPEEQAALDKKRRRDALFAAIGDGVSALSNLYFTTKGSPSADQSKSLSKAIRDRDEKEDKEYESAMDRRIRLLKEQRAEYFRLEELKIKQGLAEAEKAAKEAKTANDLKKAEDMREYYTEKNQILKEEKKAEEKRKAEKDKADKERQDKVADSQVNKNNAQGAAATKNARTNAAKAGEQKRHNKAMEKNKKSSSGGSKKSSGGSSKYTGPRYRATYDARTGELKGYTVSSRGTTPPTKTGGKSAKSQFSIHKK